MKAITMYKVETDHSVFATKQEADTHLKKLYGDKLYLLANTLANIDQHGAMVRFLDVNLVLFVELQQIKTDMMLVDDNDEGE